MCQRKQSVAWICRDRGQLQPLIWSISSCLQPDTWSITHLGVVGQSALLSLQDGNQPWTTLKAKIKMSVYCRKEVHRLPYRQNNLVKKQKQAALEEEGPQKGQQKWLLHRQSSLRWRIYVTFMSSQRSAFNHSFFFFKRGGRLWLGWSSVIHCIFITQFACTSCFPI